MSTAEGTSSATSPRDLLDIPDVVDRHPRLDDRIDVLAKGAGAKAVQRVDDRRAEKLNAVAGEEHRHVMTLIGG